MTQLSLQIEWHDVLPSTMIRAREVAMQGAPPGTVIAAHFQTAGRGTRERIWHAPPGSCLMFTIILPPPRDPAELASLPHHISTCIADWLSQRFALICDVKEPNDLLIGGKKVCGVLCTSRIIGTRIDHVLCGVGLNTFMSRAELPLESATSLRIEGVHLPSHEEMLPDLAQHILSCDERH